MAGVDMNEAAAHGLMDSVLPPYLTEFRARFPNMGTQPKKVFTSLMEAIWPWTRMCSTASYGAPNRAA